MENLIKMDKKIHRSSIKDLKTYYNYVYKCSKCNRNYGCDEEEKQPYLCPECEEEDKQ